MKVIIAGGRKFNNYTFAFNKLNYLFMNTDKSTIEIVSGACSTGVRTFVRPDGTNVCGADGLGEKYAHNLGLKTHHFPADWSTFGKQAGFLRNQQMADYSTHLVAFWDGLSRGTEDMIRKANIKGLKVKIVRYDDQPIKN